MARVKMARAREMSLTFLRKFEEKASQEKVEELIAETPEEGEVTAQE